MERTDIGGARVCCLALCLCIRPHCLGDEECASQPSKTSCCERKEAFLRGWLQVEEEFMPCRGEDSLARSNEPLHVRVLKGRPPQPCRSKVFYEGG
jgi:hypothetical protein